MAPARTPSMSLLQLLTLVAVLKAGIAMPRKPVCPNAEDNDFPQSVRVNMNILNPNKNCQRPFDYHNRSTSPWNLHRNEDSERYPNVIWEAECRSHYCKSPEGKLDLNLNSVPIHQEMLVLRREPQHCPLSFRLEKMLVKVGCTCVFPVVRQMG